jgi:hypothetical protein
MQHASWLFIAVINIWQTSEKQQTYNYVVLMAILPTDIQILFTNYDIITYFLNLASCSEHFISIKHRRFVPCAFFINKQFCRCANAFPNELTARSYEYCTGKHWILYWIQENKTATYFLRSRLFTYDIKGRSPFNCKLYNFSSFL